MKNFKLIGLILALMAVCSFAKAATVGGVTVLTAANIDDTAGSSAWNGVTTIAPSQNAVYDWIHLFDTDDDGKVNILDVVGPGLVKVSSVGLASLGTSADFVSPTDPITNLVTYGTTTQSGSLYATEDFPNGYLITSSGGKSGTNNVPMRFTNDVTLLATITDSTGSKGAAGAVLKSGGSSAPIAWGTDNGTYTITFGGLGAASTPAVNSTAYGGHLSGNWNLYGTEGKYAYIVTKAGTLTKIAYGVQGTGGDAVNTVVTSIRINNSTVVGSDTFAWGTTWPIRRPTLTVSQALAVDDYVEVQVVTPSGWTAPTVCTLGAFLTVQTTN